QSRSATLPASIPAAESSPGFVATLLSKNSFAHSSGALPAPLPSQTFPAPACFPPIPHPPTPDSPSALSADLHGNPPPRFLPMAADHPPSTPHPESSPPRDRAVGDKSVGCHSIPYSFPSSLYALNSTALHVSSRTVRKHTSTESTAAESQQTPRP